YNKSISLRLSSAAFRGDPKKTGAFTRALQISPLVCIGRFCRVLRRHFDFSADFQASFRLPWCSGAIRTRRSIHRKKSGCPAPPDDPRRESRATGAVFGGLADGTRYGQGRLLRNGRQGRSWLTL